MTGTFQLHKYVRKRDRFANHIIALDQILYKLFALLDFVVDFKIKWVGISDPAIVLSQPLFSADIGRNVDWIIFLTQFMAILK